MKYFQPLYGGRNQKVHFHGRYSSSLMTDQTEVEMFLRPKLCDCISGHIGKNTFQGTHRTWGYIETFVVLHFYTSWWANDPYERALEADVLLKVDGEPVRRSSYVNPAYEAFALRPGKDLGLWMANEIEHLVTWPAPPHGIFLDECVPRMDRYRTWFEPNIPEMPNWNELMVETIDTLTRKSGMPVIWNGPWYGDDDENRLMEVCDGAVVEYWLWENRQQWMDMLKRWQDKTMLLITPQDSTQSWDSKTNRNRAQRAHAIAKDEGFPWCYGKDYTTMHWYHEFMD